MNTGGWQRIAMDMWDMCYWHSQARSKQCLIGPAITKLSAGDLGAG